MTLFFRTSLLAAFAAITTLAFLPDYSALPEAVSISDLLNHATAFATLYLLWRFSFTHSPLIIMIGLLTYGISIEIIQSFLPTRSASIEDVMADTAGMIIGYLLALVLQRKKQ